MKLLNIVFYLFLTKYMFAGNSFYNVLVSPFGWNNSDEVKEQVDYYYKVIEKEFLVEENALFIPSVNTLSQNGKISLNLDSCSITIFLNSHDLVTKFIDSTEFIVFDKSLFNDIFLILKKRDDETKIWVENNSIYFESIDTHVYSPISGYLDVDFGVNDLVFGAIYDESLYISIHSLIKDNSTSKDYRVGEVIGLKKFPVLYLQANYLNPFKKMPNLLSIVVEPKL